MAKKARYRKAYVGGAPRRRPERCRVSADSLAPHGLAAAKPPRVWSPALPVLVVPGTPDRLLLGRDRVARAAGDTVVALRVMVPPAEWDRISQFDWALRGRPSEIAHAARVLWDAGVRLADISWLLDLDVGPSAVQRIVTASRAPSRVLSLLDAGRLQWIHLRHLQPLAAEDQLRWAEDAARERWGASELERRLALGAGADGHLKQHADRLRDALQVKGVRLDRTRTGYRLGIEWVWLPELQTALERLAQGPVPESLQQLPRQARELALELSSEELEVLTGHLVAEE